MNIIDRKSLLSPAQKNLLTNCAQKSFKLGKYTSLDDIVTKLKVDVFIEPGKPTYSVDNYYNEAIEYRKKVVEQLRERMRVDKSLQDEYRKALEKYERLFSEKMAHASMSLLGLYNSQKNIIKLYPEAMAAADASKMDEYLVSTLAHEVMHAYFNRPRHKSFPYAMFVEEPLAEFGMLLYMHETQSPYYKWAHDNVSKKNCCYRYGADIMDQYIIGGDKSLRNYLEDYKILIGEYEMPDISNGKVLLPKKNEPVNISGQTIIPQWQDIINNPPRCFYDKTTKTLGIDGDWGDRDIYLAHSISVEYRFLIYGIHDVQYLYLGENFNIDHHSILKKYLTSLPILVSPKNTKFDSKNGIPIWKKNNRPVLSSCGDDLYELKREGKYGIIDQQLNNITPFKYDFIWSFDDNDLCKVKIGKHYGLVNKQGKEQVDVIYEDIHEDGNFYKVKLNGEEFTIDKSGNRID